MDRSLWGHTLLAAGCTAAAYTAWVAPNITEKDDAVVVLAGSAAELSAIEWHDEGTDVAVSRDGDQVAVSITKLQPPSPPATYPGSDAASKLFDKLAPLTAVRALGTLPDDKLKAFGLMPAKNRLVLHRGAQAHSLDVGTPAFGSGDYYVRGEGGTVYLLRSAQLASLGHGAIALQDRDALGLAEARHKFDHVVIQFNGAERHLVQRHGEAPGKAFFADPADPDKKLEQLSGWMDRILRLRVVDLDDTAPAGEPRLSVRFEHEKARVADVSLYPTNDTKGAVGRSSRFKTPVILYRATVESVLHDAESALAEGK